MSKRLFCCADLSFQALPDGTCRVETTSASYHLRGNDLGRLFQRTLPRLKGQDLADGSLDREELLQLEAFSAKLEQMGVLLAVDDECASLVRDETDIALLTYLARTTSRPAEHYARLKRQPVLIAGADVLVSGLRSCLQRVMPHVEVVSVEALSAGELRSSAITIVLVPEGDEDVLYSLNERFHREQARWAPVVYGRNTVAIGPWCHPGQTACYECMRPRAQEPEPRQASERSGRGATTRAWRVAQPYAISFVGGILALQLEGALCPVGESTPWSRRIELDLVRIVQHTARVWRRPSCRACSRTDALPQRWS